MRFNVRLAISSHAAPFSTWSQSPSVYLYSTACDSGPDSVIRQCVASTWVIGSAPGSQSGYAASSEWKLPAMCTGPVVPEGTVTVKMTCTLRSAAVAVTEPDAGDVFVDVSIALTTYVYVVPLTTLVSANDAPVDVPTVVNAPPLERSIS